MDGEIAKVMPHECDVVETRDQCAGLVALKVHPTMAGYKAWLPPPGARSATL